MVTSGAAWFVCSRFDAGAYARVAVAVIAPFLAHDAPNMA
jgi:hypothetical protein